MKRKDFLNDLRSKTVKELVSLRKEYRKKLFDLRMKNFVKWLKRTHEIKEMRRNIARINTVLHIKIKDTYGSDK